MTEVATNEYHEWLLVNGYMDEDGVLTIDARDARALYCFSQIQRDKEEI